MVEPITLAAVGSVVLTEGIKFLYKQAGEILKHWRERQADAAKQATTAPEANVADPKLFEGTLAPLVVHFDRVEPLAPSLKDLWVSLTTYAQGLDEVETSNAELLSKADMLRRQLEAIYGQRITFRGEPRASSGTPVVVGTADLETIAGQAAGVIAGTIASGTIHGELRAKRVEPGAQAAGVKVDRIGG